MKNLIYRQLKLHGAWQKKAEEHAANGQNFSVYPFNKATHWPFLEELSQRYDLVTSFDARERTASFHPRGF